MRCVLLIIYEKEIKSICSKRFRLTLRIISKVCFHYHTKSLQINLTKTQILFAHFSRNHTVTNISRFLFSLVVQSVQCTKFLGSKYTFFAYKTFGGRCESRHGFKNLGFWLVHKFTMLDTSALSKN